MFLVKREESETRQMQGHARRGEGTRGHEARLHGMDLLGRPALFVADEPTQPIFDDGPPEDIEHHCAAPPHGTPGRNVRCANVFFSAAPTGLWLTTTGPGRSVASLDGAVTPCCRRAGLTSQHWIGGRSRERCHPGALLVRANLTTTIENTPCVSLFCNRH
jgi:hypothetical protein